MVASTEHEPIPILGGEVARAVVHDVHRVRGPGNDPVAPRALQERQQRRRIAQTNHFDERPSRGSSRRASSAKRAKSAIFHATSR